MAVETPSIARPLAPAPSLNYEQLFLEGIQHIEKLSGKIWTDYNAHDPGITILEVLSYAITELGYRCDYEMGDLVAPSPESAILNDFFSLANIATNAPLTIDDFRKLLIDIEGNRNAWLEKVTYESVTGVVDTDPNATLYYHKSVTGNPDPVLDNDVEPDPLNGRQIKIKGLYDVFLQFDEHPEFGDLNDNSLKATLDMQPIGFLAAENFDVEFEFPIWETVPDEAEADTLYNYLETGTLPTFTVHLPDATDPVAVTGEEFVYTFTMEVHFTWLAVPYVLSLKLSARVVSNSESILNHNDFRNTFRSRLAPGSPHTYDSTSTTQDAVIQIVLDFIYRRQAIKELLETSRLSLANHRNLCEDFRAVYPMSLQEIGLDLDLDIAPGTDCESVMARVYYLTQQYLSPVIRFYSLREMLEKGYTAEQIFRGPWLLNGFIDENDLSFYQRRDILYTSDLVQEFMGIEGVRAVNYIAFSRYQFGMLAEKSGVLQQRMTECLCLENPARYLPRLNFDRSNILMNCGAGKPSQPNKANALKLLSEQNAIDNLKGKAPQGDFEIPEGTYSNLGEYHSIQHEFPLNYAIGTEGLAPDETDLRKAQAQQLKGYLLFFEQLLGNFLAQVENLRKLFSFSDEIDRTYFTQALYMVPRVDRLIRDFTENHETGTFDFDDYLAIQDPNSDYYALKLDALAESNPVFLDRRKRFLDHLVARFGESFSEYAAYVFGRSITTAEKHGVLIKDQARFLRSYIMHSHDRGTGFNYQRSLEVDANLITNWYWRAGLDIESLNQQSGVVEPLPVENPDFVDPYAEFDIYLDGTGNYRFRLYNANGLNMLYSATSYADVETLKAALDLMMPLAIDITQYNIMVSPITLGAYAKVGTAFINSYDGAMVTIYPAGLVDLVEYLNQINTVQVIPSENEAGHALWQGVNDVTGIKKRMVFLTGLPNVNRQYIHPLSRFNITGAGTNWTYELIGDEGEAILTPGTVIYASEADTQAAILYLFENLATLVIENQGSDDELRTATGDPTSVVGVVEPDFMSAYAGSYSEATAGMVAYLEGLYNVENLHVVEHILLRQRYLDEPTLEARRDDNCPALDIEDPYSFRISVILPKWAGRFKEQAFRTMFKRLMRAEVPAHVYIHFFWIDPLQMLNFEQHWATWLKGGWQGIEGITQTEIDASMVVCLNGLKNLLDAQYVIEPPKIIDAYTLCEVIAAPYDPDGDIVKAWLAPGYTMPPGLCLDPCSGAIKVTDKTLLDDENPIDLEIITINAGGEEVWHDITLEFIANGNAVVDFVIDTKYICFYNTAPNTDGMSMIRFRDSDMGGTIIEASLLNWTREEPAGTVLQSGTTTPPAGLSFNIITGEIKISNHLLLLSGIYEFEVLLQDNSGGFTILVVSFTILPDREAVATVTAPMNEDAYVAGSLLATVTDPDGNLSSVVEAGFLPTFATMGLAFDAGSMPASMKIVVSNPTTFRNWLTSGSPAITLLGFVYHFTLRLKTQDHCNGKTDLNIPIKVNKDHEAIFIQVPVINVSLHYVGSPLGRFTDVADGGLVSYNLAANNAVLSPKGIEMYMETAVNPDEARLRVLNKATFVTAINTASSVSGGIATLTIPLQTKDATGGLSTVNAIIKARQDFPPVVTVTPHANVDSYVLWDVLATIEDSDGTGISSATHVVNGFTLASIGMQLRYQGGYVGYPNQNYNSNFNRNLGNFRMGNLGSLQGQSNNYQTIPAPLFYQQPTTDRYAEIVVSNVGLFRQAVMTNPAYTVVNVNTHLVRVTLVINTTDSLGGFSSNTVEIEIYQDVEAVMTEIMNGERIDDISGGHIMLRFEDIDPNTTLTNATVVPALPKEFGKTLTSNRFDIYVANRNMLTPGTWPITVTLTDNAQGQTVMSVDLKVLPRLVKANFTVAATQQGHILNLGSKVSGLKMLALNPPYLPKTFGSINVNNGVQIGFDEGSSYGSSNYSMTVGFTGIITTTNEPVEGELTIGRQVVKLNNTVNKGLEVLSGNTLVNSKTTGGDAQLRKLADATGSMTANLNNVTYYPDNPMLRTNEGLMADYAAGAKDEEVANAMKGLAAGTAKEILRLQETMRTTQGAAKPSASQSLEVYAEIMRMQVMNAIHYAGNIRENDFAQGSALAGLFASYRELLKAIFDGKISNMPFTELAKLRGTLRDAQDHFDTLKPNLHAAILALMPVAPSSQFSGIEALLPSPHSGEVNADVATLLDIFRDLFEEIDGLMEDPDFRVRWREGAAVSDVDSLIREPFTYLATYIKNAETRIKELPYGTQQLDLSHAHARATDLLNVATNALFEILDQLPNEIQGTQPMIDLTDFLGQEFNKVSAQPALAEFRNLTASWASKWPLKPMLSVPTGGYLEVATLEMQPRRVLDRYKTGDSLGAVVMKSGTLATIFISKGLLPRGLSLSNAGKIWISDASLLMVGIFGGLEISGTNDRGFAFTLVVPDIEFYRGSDTTYYVEPPHELGWYVEGFLLAYPSDPDGEIASAQVQAGTFPPGVRFDTETGNFTVAKVEKLVPGSYDLTVVTEDVQGGLTTEEITIVIGSSGTTEITLSFQNIQLPVSVGDILATVTANAIAIVSWTGINGRMPAGTEMNNSGEIRVNDNEAINVGTFSWDILATGTDQLTYLIHITMEIVSIPIEVPVSVQGISLQQTSGAVLLVLEVTGQTLSSFSGVTSGALPPGCDLTSNGEIVVDQPSDLQPGTYTFEVHGFTSTHADYLFQVTMGFATSRPPISYNVSFEGVELPIFADDIIGVIDVKGISLSDVKVISGVLPTNTSVRLDGTILVGLGQGRVPGTYTFVVTGLGSDLNDYEVTVVIELVDNEQTRSFTQMLTIKLPVRINDVAGQIVSPAQALLHTEVISGSVPGGLKVLADGSLLVTNPSLVRAGRYAFEVLCLGDDGYAYDGHIEVEVVG